MTVGVLIPWKSLPASLHRALEAVRDFERAWTGTPYVPGQRLEGVGVDCIRFCAAFGCTMEKREHRERAEPDDLPQDVAFHKPDTARAAIRNLMERFPLWKRVRRPAGLEPGDLLVVGPLGVPAHGMVVSSRPNSLIHASPEGVAFHGIGLDPKRMAIQHVYRSTERGSWS